MVRHHLLDRALERDLLPDAVLRHGARVAAVARTRRAGKGGVEAQEERLRELVARMSSGPIAAAPDTADELPAEFYGLVLGPRRKASACLWADGIRDLAGAEEAMLALTCARAGIVDGMGVLDLGCGWGSLSLWVAEQYPRTAVLGVASSDEQREWLQAEAARRGLSNLEVRAEDFDALNPGRRFDRVVSTERFEHVRNWAELLRRISTWLEPDGKLFVDVRSHRRLPLPLAGAVVPPHDMMGFFQRDLVLQERWVVPGTHYAQTARAWLRNLARNRAEAVRIVGRIHPPSVARRLLATRRRDLISAAATWGRRDGEEWLVSHYLLAPR